MGAFVGIDLGTTFSVVAHIDRDGAARALPADGGKLLMPSVVDLRPDPPLVGWAAKEGLAFGDESVCAFFKREMGSPHALYLHGGRVYTPVDLSALVLARLKRSAEAALGQSVTDAVITVPAYFNNLQRQDTIAAGQQAGLNVLRIISEPTAAALAYGLRPQPGVTKALVYDLGGGTFDVSLVEIAPDALRVIATAGDHYLGGKDWDDRILQHLAASFERQYGVELADADLSALAVQAEEAKIALSALPAAHVTVQAGGQRASYEITRDQFAAQTRDLMERTQLLVEQTLADAGLTWAELAGVVLVGGATRMPMVAEYVTRMAGRPPLAGADPDLAVALGAAIQAGMDLSDRQREPMLLLGGRRTVDVISNSLGMIAENEDRSAYINSIIIRKNQPIPCRQTRPYQLRVGREARLEVFMTQGETPDPQGAKYLGRYVFSGIPPVAGGGVAVIDITYAYNISGVVEVTAVERSTQMPLTLAVEPLPADVPERFALPPAQEAAREHLHLYLVFDLSGSMTGTPLAEARKAAQRLVDGLDLSTTSVGVIEFSDRTQTTLKASQNAAAIARALAGLNIGRTGLGTTAVPFDEVYNLLWNAPGLRCALVLTDGAWAHQQKAIERAQRCHKNEVDVIAVGFGRADERFLRAISSSDQHSFFTSLDALGEVFSTIAQELTEGGGQFDPARMQERRRGLALR